MSDFDPASNYQEQATQAQPTEVKTPPTDAYAHADEPYSSDVFSGANYSGANGPINPGAMSPISVDPPMHQQKKGGTIKNLLTGLLGGAVGSLLVTLALNAGGFLGGSSSNASSTSTPSDATVTGGDASNSNISITTDQGTTVAEAVAAKCLPSVVSVNVTTDSAVGLGSGVILDTDGNIITNAHVVEGATEISVTLGGITYPAELVGTDDSSDIAVVKADFQDLEVTPIEIGDSDELVVGDWVMTIGSPYGLEQSVSAGIVSALSRSTTMSGTSGSRIYGDLIQVDANINSGNSGGALVNDRGQLVGINTLFESSSGAFAGIGFSISGNYAVSIANKIIAGESVTHAYIGLSMLTVTPQNSLGIAVDSGAYVADILVDSPAGEAGIQEGDVVVKIDDITISSADEVIVAIRGHEEGDTVRVVVNRDGEELTFDVTLGNDEQLQLLQQQQYEEQQQNNYPQQYNQQMSPYDDYYQQFFEELFGFGQ